MFLDLTDAPRHLSPHQAGLQLSSISTFYAGWLALYVALAYRVLSSTQLFFHDSEEAGTALLLSS